MKMIYVGTLAKDPDRDSGWINSFRDLGWSVVPFSSNYPTQTGIINRVYRRLNIGKQNRKIQNNLLLLVKNEQPIWIHFRLPVQFSKSTIKKIKESGALVTQYFNDDPFSQKRIKGHYFKFKKSISEYDGNFVYRHHNIKNFIDYGARHVEHCPPAYDPSRHINTLKNKFDHKFLADVAFIGHFENDCRKEYLEHIKNEGFSIILKGGMWDTPLKNSTLAVYLPISHAFGLEYNNIYANVIAGLCFFSKINRDTWTERAFEIIAVGGVLVCERTNEALSYFEDRQEACFFSSKEELVKIIIELKNNPEYRSKIQDLGYKKLLKSNNSINDRAIQIVNFVKSKM